MYSAISWVAVSACVVLGIVVDVAAQPVLSEVRLADDQRALGRIAPGQTTVVALFETHVAESVVVHIYSTIGDLLTSVQTPDLQIIDPSSISNFDGHYLAIEGSSDYGAVPSLTAIPGFHYFYAFPIDGETLTDGVYVVNVSSPPPVTQDVPVITEFRTRSPWRAALFTQENADQLVTTLDDILAQGDFS